MEKKGIIYNLIMKRKAALAIVVILFILGGICFQITPKQQYPIIELPMVIITTVYPGASPSDMEELVTSKIEDECLEAEGFDNVKSDSYNGISVVKVAFSRELSETELQDKMDKLRVKINALKDNELPSGVTSLTYNDNAFETCGLILSFTGENKSNEELTQRAESLKDKISGTDGVIRTEVEGELEQQVKITVDSSKLSHTPVSLAELASIIGYQNSTIPVGTIEFDNNEMYIKSSGKLESIDEIKDIIININKDTGAVVKLRDVADVEMSYNEDSKKYNYNGENAVVLSVFFDDNDNILSTGQNVLDIVNEYKETIPDDIQINNIVYLADDVNSSINDFIVNLIESVLIVLLVVMIGMSIINGSIVAFVIPLTIFLTFIAMVAFDIDVQFVSLASLIIALGMLVDNAIVVSDAIQVRIDNGEEKLSACVNGTKEVALPVFSSMLTTVAIFCVFYVLPGTMRRFVFSLPTIVIAALVFSYLVSMLITPIMCYMLMKKSKVKKQRKQLVRGFFSSLLHIGLKFRIITLIISVACICSSVFFLSHLDLELVPNSDKMLLDINVETDNLYDIRKTEKAVSEISEILKNDENVEYYLSAVGGRVPKYDFTSLPSTDSTNTGSFVVKIKDLGDTSKGVYCQELENKIKKVVTDRVTVKEIGIIPKSSELVQFDICGDDMETINNAAIQAEQWLKENPDAKNVFADTKTKSYNYYVDIKNDSLNSSGLTKSEVLNELNIAMMGRTVTNYRKDSKEYPIVLKTESNDIDSLKNIQIKSSTTSGKYKLSQVANINYISDYSKISRYNGQKCITVSALPKTGKSAVEIQNSIKNRLEEANLQGTSIVYEGDSDMFEQVISSLSVGALLGSLAIFLILYLQFYSVSRSIIIFVTIPFALIGSSIGLYCFGENLSMFAILGIISLIGVVVNNAIVLVDYMDTELAKGVSSMEACKTAVDKRFRPIILSTSTTILGLIPLAISGNVIFRGLAIAFMCGLSTSLFFTLIVIPVIYSLLVKKLPKKG